MVLGFSHLGMHRNREWFETLPAGIWQWFDLNAESSVGTWFSVSLLLLIGVGAALAAVAEPSRRDRLGWAVIAICATVLSLDDKISMHERLPEFFSIERATLATHEWLVPGIAITVVGVAILAYSARTLDRPVRHGLLLALAVFLLGALVIEGLSGYFVRSFPVAHPLRASLATWVLIEETLEMLGSIIALATIHSHLDRRGVLRRRPDPLEAHLSPPEQTLSREPSVDVDRA